MPTLRDRVRDALASADSTEKEAREDLDAVMRRVRAQGARPSARTIAVVPALAAVAFVAYFAMGRSRAPSPAASSRDRGVHLYVRVVSEPEEHALTIDLVAQGNH